MLAFLKEHAANSPGDNEVDGQIKEPDDGTHQTDDEYLTVSSNAENDRKSMIWLCVVFGIGLLSVGIMIKYTTAGSAQAGSAVTEQADLQIEKAIAKLTGVRSEMSDSLGKIVDKFHEFSNVKQIKVTKLAKNPFKHQLFIGDLDAKSSSESAFDTGMNFIGPATGKMQLFSIMTSGDGRDGRSCMIDGKILYEGDLIRGLKVEVIGESFVELESKEGQVILKLSDNDF
ncbi:MAG: hypothetical protein ACYSRZ_10310 [Planctomycetota bacterium]|jgi:hypothetical protein